MSTKTSSRCPSSRRWLRITLWSISGFFGALIVLGTAIGLAHPQSSATASAAPVTPTSAPTAPVTAGTPSAPAAPTSTAPSVAVSDPSRLICRITDPTTGDNTGTYYFASANSVPLTYYETSMCLTSPTYPGTTADLMSLPGMKLRCTDPAWKDGTVQSVYSDSKGDDLAAAQSACGTNGGA